MKKLVSILVMAFFALAICAQEEPETTSPLTDVVVVRKVDRLDLDGEILRNVEVTLNPVSPDYLINDKYKVKVKVTDFRGKKIWKKTLKGVFLYVFSNGQIQVGRKNFRPLVIWEPTLTDGTTGIIREREGVY